MSIIVNLYLLKGGEDFPLSNHECRSSNQLSTYFLLRHPPPSVVPSIAMICRKQRILNYMIHQKSMWSDFSFYFLGWNVNPRTRAFHFPRSFTRGFCKFIFVHRATHFSAAGRKLRDMALADWFRTSFAVEEESNKRNSFVDSTSAFRDSLCNRWMNDTKKIGTTDGKSVARLDSIWMVSIQTGTRLYSYWSQKRAKFDKRRAFCGAQFHFRKFNFSIGVKVLLQTSPLTWELNGRRPVRCHFSSVRKKALDGPSVHQDAMKTFTFMSSASHCEIGIPVSSKRGQNWQMAGKAKIAN